MKFTGIGINDKIHNKSLNLLNKELAPLINECFELSLNEDCDQDPEFTRLIDKCKTRYKEIPRGYMSYNGGREPYFNDFESVDMFVTCFTALFKKYKNSFNKPKVIPQFDI